MTTMDFEDLMKLGFNRNEAIVYLALVRFGKADANQLIKETKFHKNIVYDNLEKLIDKGLATFIVEESRKVFSLAPPDALVQYFDEQDKKLNEKKQLAMRLSKEIEKTAKNAAAEQQATVYRGVPAIKSFYAETLQLGDYVAFGAPKQSVQIMGEHFWKNYVQKRIENKINAKIIFNPSLKNFGNDIKNKHTKIRYFKHDFEPMTETHIQKDKIAIIVWSETPVLFLLQDKLVADSYKAFFEKMWKDAKN